MSEPDFADSMARARAGREQLLQQRRAAVAELPLKYWNQQAHFTTPASGAPEKAIRGLAAAGRILERFDISTAELAAAVGAAPEVFTDLLADSDHSPLVMVDAEDAVALTDKSLTQARDGAIRCFSQENWGTTLAFFRPGGLGLDSCIEDLFTVLPAVARDCAAENYPVDGVIWPKAEHPDEIAWVSDTLGEIEQRLGLPENRIKLEFLVESGFALKKLDQLAQAAAPRLAGIIWGIADYAADTNLPEIRNDHPVCDWARYEIVNVAGAMGVPAIDCMTLNYPTPVHRGKELTDSERGQNKAKVLGALKEAYDDARHGMLLGMSGKWVGHPAQLLMVLAAYRDAIPASRIEQDRREIDAYSESVAAGAGATMIGVGTQAYMADRATDRHLRARLRRAAAWGLLPMAEAKRLGVVTAEEVRGTAG